MEERDVITWTVMTGVRLAQHGCDVEAYKLFLRMQREGYVPDATAYVSILNTCALSAGALEWVKEVHSHVLERGLEWNFHMNANSGSFDDARQVFDKFLTSIDGGRRCSCMVCDNWVDSHNMDVPLEYFSKMIADGVKPNGNLFVAVLLVCSHPNLVTDYLIRFDHRVCRQRLCSILNVTFTLKFFSQSVELMKRQSRVAD